MRPPLPLSTIPCSQHCFLSAISLFPQSSPLVCPRLLTAFHCFSLTLLAFSVLSHYFLFASLCLFGAPLFIALGMRTKRAIIELMGYFFQGDAHKYPCFCADGQYFCLVRNPNHTNIINYSQISAKNYQSSFLAVVLDTSRLFLFYRVMSLVIPSDRSESRNLPSGTRIAFLCILLPHRTIQA